MNKSLKNLTLLVTSFFLLLIALGTRDLKNSTNILIDPQAQTTNTQRVIDEQIKPRLSKNINTFKLNNNKNPFVPQAEADTLALDAKALMSVDLDTGEVLYEKNSKERLPIASLTKIMTAVVALDLADSDELFTITDFAAQQIPTKIGVVPDEKMKLRELIDALMLTSANDAATVIQQGIDTKYGGHVFIRAMNEKARFLGLSDTSFANPQGFDDPDNFSTVSDLAVLTNYALTYYNDIAESVRKDYQFLPQDTNHKQFDLYNWNGLVGVYPDTIGMKIGNTGRAGKTTVAVSQRNGKKIMSAVLGAPDLYSRDLYAAELLDYGYLKALNLPPVKVTRAMLQDKYNTWKYF